MGKKLRRKRCDVTSSRSLSVTLLNWRLSIHPKKPCAKNRFPTWKAWHPGFKTRALHYGICQLPSLPRMMEPTRLRNVAVRTWCVLKHSCLLLKSDYGDDSTFSGDRQGDSDYLNCRRVK